MNQFQKLFGWSWSILVVCALAFAMGGCEGDDGAQGPPGADGADGTNGTDGTDGADALVIPLESCGVCHGPENFGDAAALHAVTGIAAVSDVTFLDVAGDLQVSFNLAVDGVAVVEPPAVDSTYVFTAADSTTIRLDPATNPITIAPGAAGGDFIATISGGTALAGEAARFYLRLGMQGVVSGDFPAAALPNIASNDSCTGCHGPKGLTVHARYGYPGMEASECVVCHKAQEGIWNEDGVPRFEYSFVGIVHGIHNAHDRYGGFTYGDHEFKTTYPSYMTNCSVCHSADEIVAGELTQLTAANSMPVSGEGCLSCHGGMEAWSPWPAGLEFHLTNITDPLTHDCQSQCHEPMGAAQTKIVVADFHNGIETERHGWILDGEDVSLTEGALFDWRITGVEVIDDGANLAVSWAADYGDPAAGVDPCNDTVAAGEPVFFLGPNLEEMTMYRNYAQGDDFLLGPGSSPGAPSSVDLDATNTTCQDGIATTVLAVDAVTAMKGRVALGGKPLVVAPEGLAGLPGVPAVIEARVPTPTFDFLLADGSAAPARRAVVDTGKCLGCHVGSLYQHGGDRVDNVDMCLMCHNVASNEQNVREGMGLVDAADTYDGKVGETYGMKTMLHRVHSANWEFKGDRFNAPYLVYRNRGIYAFAKEGDFPPNWDTGAACTDRYGRPGTIVSGADPALTTACQVHNFEAPTFPRSLNECAACHDAKFASVIPDQMIAMATTVEAGAAPWNVYLDDVLQGAATTACITCHYSSSTKGHAYLNSWAPQEFPEGRQTIIDAVN